MWGQVLCGACTPPKAAYFSADGRCESVRRDAVEASCQVDGLVYPNGASGVVVSVASEWFTIANVPGVVY